METLFTDDGTELDLDQADADFARAMSAPTPDEPMHAAPPKVMSEEELGEKYGWTTDKDGNRRAKKAAGRPSTKARTTNTPDTQKATAKASKSNSGTPEPKDYTEDLNGVASVVYGALCAAGNYADAGAVSLHADRVVPALNHAAQENPVVRKGVELLTKGGAIGALMFAVLPMALQIGANHGAVPVERVAAFGVRDPQALANEVEAELYEMAQGMQEAA